MSTETRDIPLTLRGRLREPATGERPVSFSVLFYGGYAEERGRSLLGRLQDDALAKMVRCRLIAPSGEPPKEVVYVVGRGPRLHLFTDTDWYSADVRELF